MDSERGAELARCRVYGFMPILAGAMFGLLVFVGVPLAAWAALTSGDRGGQVFFIVWLASVCWFGFVTLVKVGFQVRLLTGGDLEVRSALRRVSVDAGALVRVGYARSIHGAVLDPDKDRPCIGPSLGPTCAAHRATRDQPKDRATWTLKRPAVGEAHRQRR